MTNTRVYRTVCGFCHAGCGLKVYHSGSGIDRIEGDPDHPGNRGYVCSKVVAIGELGSSRDRLTYPLRKTPNGFKRISWEEALEFAAERLGEIRDKYGPGSLVRNGGAPVNYEARDGFLQFMGAFGSPNFAGASNLCMLPRITAFNAVTGAKPEPDFERANLIIFWGANSLATNRFGGYCAYNGFNQIIPRAKQRGARLIAIDPVRSETVSQVDEWVQINPGTDVALALAMINVIIAEGLYDKDFVTNWLYGFDELRAYVRAYTPSWAEVITGIPTAMITDLARRYATIKPATICDGNGTDMYLNDVDCVRAIAILIGLTGNWDVAGGNGVPPFARQSVLPTKMPRIDTRIWYKVFPLFRDVPFTAVKEALLRDESYRPRAMIVHHGNPVLVQANEARTRQALKKLDFLLVNEIFLTSTAEMADLIIPSTSCFERYGYKAYSSFEGGFLALARPVAEPPGESRSVFEVEYELAKRMGLHHDYPFYDTLSWLDYMLKPTGVTFEQLDKEQIVYATPEIQYRKYLSNGFNTPSRKLEVYSQQFLRSGYAPLPAYHEPAGEPLISKSGDRQKFTLLGTSRKPALFVHTNFRNIKTLTQRYPEPLVWMHPQDARQRGIHDGDGVEVISPRGQIMLGTKLSEDTKSGLVMIDFGWGNPTDRKASINILTDDEFWEPVSGATPNRMFSCEVAKKK